jgi:hypothetical protein
MLANVGLRLCDVRRAAELIAGVGSARAAGRGCIIMGRIIIAALVCGIVSGCSSALPSLDFFKSSPSTETLRIASEPPGAEAKSTSGQSCKTPCELEVQPGSDQSITLALNGYQPQTVPLRQDGGDTGKLGPNPVIVKLQTLAPVATKKKTTAAKKKTNKPTATAAVTSPTAPTSNAPPAVSEAAPAPSNAYPWSAGR